ncbi:MAG: glucose 1-dehydrogenase [Rhizobiaceae bacterium]|nr:MAG: glucose 1-dehydrogenase [Rhizobiaceae bacterium]
MQPIDFRFSQGTQFCSVNIRFGPGEQYMPVKYDYSGSVVLATGAGSGMGRATALAFARAGAKVVVVDWNEADGQETAESIGAMGGEALFLKADVSDSEAVQDFVAQTVSRFGKLDIAFNNAAIFCDPKKIHETDDEAWHRVVAVDQTSVFLCLKHQVRQMLKQGTGGVIVNTASTNALDPSPLAAPYNAAKAAVIALGRTAALEYAEDGIRVNTLVPGSIMTKMMADAFKVGPPSLEKNLRNYSAMRRIGDPDEIAMPVLWLCSDAATYVTGTEMIVDGGHMAGTLQIHTD